MKVRWSAAAKDDRAEIVNYIGRDNPRAALRMDQTFSDAASQLADLPMRGRPGKVPGTRELIPHANYRLIYEVMEETVWILTLVHTARQWPPASD